MTIFISFLIGFILGVITLWKRLKKVNRIINRKYWDKKIEPILIESFRAKRQ